MDVYHITRTKNIMLGWNNNKEVYKRTFETIESAKIMVKWAKNYIKNYGWLSDNQLKMNIDYILNYVDLV